MRDKGGHANTHFLRHNSQQREAGRGSQSGPAWPFCAQTLEVGEYPGGATNTHLATLVPLLHRALPFSVGRRVQDLAFVQRGLVRSWSTRDMHRKSRSSFLIGRKRVVWRKWPLAPARQSLRAVVETQAILFFCYSEQDSDDSRWMTESLDDHR